MSDSQPFPLRNTPGHAGVLLRRIPRDDTPLILPRAPAPAALRAIWWVRNEAAVRSIGPTEGHTARELLRGGDWLLTGSHVRFFDAHLSPYDPREIDVLLVYAESPAA